jgi:Mn2+/Fe2+ NRAMP family transporter
MSRLLSITLGVLTAIGGFLDIGELVTGSLTGARFGLSLAWVVVLGVVAIMLYAEMSARVAAVTGRAVFDVVRERLGPRAALANLSASFLINVITLAAEIGGVALALQLASDVSYLLWVPLVAVLVWVVLWRLPYGAMEKIYGLLGLALLVFVVALVKLHPIGAVCGIRPATRPSRPGRDIPPGGTTRLPCSARPSRRMKCSSSPPAPSRKGGPARI